MEIFKHLIESGKKNIVKRVCAKTIGFETEKDEIILGNEF